MDPIQPYRQPVVTATGIFLGFMLEYTIGWFPQAFSKNNFKDFLIAISIILSVPLLIIVLFRILKMNYSSDHVKEYYGRTLTLFLIAVSLPFICFLVFVIQKLVTNIV
jgi:hypothetical protein